MNTENRTLIVAIVAVILTAISVWMTCLEHVPNKPDLEIYPAEYLDEPPTLLAQHLSDLNTSGGKGAKVRLYIKNKGGMETQHMTVRVVSPTFLASNTGNIETIKEGSTGSAVLYIRQDCLEEKCNQSLLPEGEVPITFKFTCRNCEPREFTKTFSFNIAHLE